MVETWGVAELAERISGAIAAAFPDEVWVAGEIQGLRPGGKHLYFTLVEPGALGSSAAASLPVALFAGQRARVEHALRRAGGLELADGLAVRVRGEVIVYAARSQVQLRMTAVDPAHTLGQLAIDRDRLLRALGAEGLIERNRAVPLPPVPSRIALVTSAGSAAAHDVLHVLEASGLGFEVTLLDARVQGVEAVDSVTMALHRAAQLEVDAVALVRGGGSRTDLVAFDAEAVARAVATHPHPVLAGIGHEIDTSVTDHVAHRSFPTPTAVATFLVDRVRSHLDALERSWSEVARHAERHLARADDRLDALAERAVAAAGSHLVRADTRTVGITTRVAVATAHHLTRADDRTTALTDRLGTAATHHLRRADDRVLALSQRVDALDPARVLARGWSITRTADGGLLRSVDAVDVDDELVTTVVDGSVRSRVLERPTDTTTTTTTTTTRPARSEEDPT